MPLVIVEDRGPIGIVTLNNPAKRNCLSNELLGELLGTLDAFDERRARVVILRAAAGAPVWSAGFDVRALPEHGRDPLAYDDPLERVIRRIQTVRAPVIAMIEGGVYGGACDVALTCDLAVGCPTASFSMSPAKMGVPYNSAGILHFINVVGARVAREMFFTARPIPAERALVIGLLNHLVPVESLESYTLEVARGIAENSPLAISVLKEQLRILSGARPITPDTFERLQSLRRHVYDSADYTEGRRAFLEKRKPSFTGS
jgi:methylmalonyl-CoA decarboxylase